MNNDGNTRDGCIATFREPDWSKIISPYLGLAQTCHQTRAEFAPLYNTEQARCFVTLSTIIPYVDTFIFPITKSLAEVQATIPYMID
jgi:hypothetical protein